MAGHYSLRDEFFSSVNGEYPLQAILRKSLSRILSIDALDALYKLTQNSAGQTFIEKILNTMNVSIRVSEEDLDQIPTSGGCIIVANHPFGGIEGILIASILQKIRPDFKIMANYFIGLIPELRDLFIFVDPFSRKDSVSRNVAPLKQSLKWVRNGGMLVLFPAGAVSHLKLSEKVISDPEWQESMGRLIERAEVPIIPVFFEGSNRLPFQTMGLIHPLLRTLRLPGELINKRNIDFKLSIGTPVTPQKLKSYADTHERLKYLRKRTYNLSNRHIAEKHDQVYQPAELVPIAEPVDRNHLIMEYSNIPQNQILFTQKGQTVFYAHAFQIPNLLHEIGRQREITFRDVQEGTGKALDVDEYDEYYLHLIAWDEETQGIIGAYRLGLTDQILSDFGKKGLYTLSLFKIKSALFKTLRPSIELGRSFIVREYQRQFSSLFLLWRGIGEFVVRNKQYRYLFGPVSISSAYKSSSQKLMLDYLLQFHKNEKLSVYVRPRNFKKKALKISPLQKELAGQLPELEDMISDIEHDASGIPILIRQYLKLGAEFVSFNIDPLFSNVIDGLIVVDLHKSSKKTIARYMWKDGVEHFQAYHSQRDKLLARKRLNRKMNTPETPFFSPGTEVKTELHNITPS